ncbi:hypothetical protein ACQJBY_049240 [Aegilops geniculata]
MAGAGASSISWALAISRARRKGRCRGRLYLLGTGDLAGRMPRSEGQQSAMAIVQCGEIAVQVETLLVGGVWHQVAVVPNGEAEVKGVEFVTRFP